MSYRPAVAGAALAAKGFLPLEAGGGGPVSPIDAGYAWDHAYWAEDPGWAHPANGGNVTVWRDAGTQHTDLTIGVPTYPVWNAADAHLGGQSSVSDTQSMGAALNCGGDTAMPQPLTAVMVFYYDGTGGTDVGCFDGGAARMFYRPRTSANTQQLYAGAGVNLGAALPAGAYFVVATFNGASSSVQVNGAAVIPAGSTVGANLLQNLQIPQPPISNSVTGAIAFIAFKGSGGLTPAQILQLQNWAHSHYGFF